MRKRWIVLGIVLLFFLVVSLIPSPEREETTSTTSTPAVTPTKTQTKELTFENKLKNEIKTSWVDVETIEYYPKTQHVNVWFVKETAWDEEHLRDTFCYASFDIMNTLVKYPDKIDTVTLIGKTTLIDPQGHKEIAKVFQAKVTMERAKNVEWKNLAELGTLKPLYDNFDDVWWHVAVRP